MKVSHLRSNLKRLNLSDSDRTRLDAALKRLDSLTIEQLCVAIEKIKAPAISVNEVAASLRALVGKRDAFEAALDELSNKKACTKPVLQQLYKSVFDTTSPLPSKMTKAEMIERMKRQRRRQANFDTA